MKRCSLKTAIRFIQCAALLALLGLGASAADEKVEIDKLPQKVAATLKAKFPGATITSATKATENGEVIYDIEVKKDGRKHEMDVKEDGTIVNFESEIAVKDLPAAVAKSVKAKYPNCTIKEVMQVMVIKDQKDVVEEYEVLIETADKKEVELTMSPDGGEKVEAGKLPQKVADTLKAKFPGAKITSATKETENGEVIYDIELTKDGRKHEMDIKEDGTIVNFENEIAVKDLPAAVANAVKAKYPNCTIKEALEVMVIKDQKDVVEEYEVIIETADKKEVELAVSPDGKKIK